jgi:hypothetical protein
MQRAKDITLVGCGTEGKVVGVTAGQRSAEKVFVIIRITIDSQNTTSICCSYLFVIVTT